MARVLRQIASNSHVPIPLDSSNGSYFTFQQLPKSVSSTAAGFALSDPFAAPRDFHQAIVPS